MKCSEKRHLSEPKRVFADTITFMLSAALLLLVVSSSRNALSQPARLDRGFGSNGIVSTNLWSFADHTRRLRVQPDGKILVLSSSDLSQITTPTVGTIDRFLPNGVHDSTFAAGGRLNNFTNLRDFELLPDGRILTVATAYALPNFGRVCRWTSNGSIDLSFGVANGCTSVGYVERFEARRIKLLPDGKILISGATGTGETLVARLLPNGSIDQAFGTDGMAFGAGGDFSYYRLPPWVVDKTGPLEVQSDGKILYGYGIDWDNYYYVGRLNSDGSVDTSFGSSGIASVGIPVPGYPYDGFAFGVAPQADGSIFVTGTAMQWWGADSHVNISKLKHNGSLDPDFGAGGSVNLESSEPRGPASAMVVLPNGKLLLGGMDDQAFSLVRLNADGSIDTRFGNSGIVQTRFGMSDLTSILAMELQPDGSLIAGGSTYGVSYSARLGLVKYLDVAETAANPPFDFDGDGRSDMSVFRPSDTHWYLNRSAAGFSAVQFGLATDALAPADFDGDGKTDISVFRDGTWYWLSSSNGQLNARQFGQQSDLPVPADYTGDGHADLAVYRAGVWWIQDVANNSVSVTSFGLPTDEPLAADYDGDGRSDIAVFRSGEWHLNLSSWGYTVINFGTGGDVPLTGDFDGDGRSDLGVYRQGVWYLQGSSDGDRVFPFGAPTDIPVPADYDGDGKTDAAIYRDGTWWVQQTATSSLSVTQFGTPNDRPIPFRGVGH